MMCSIAYKRGIYQIINLWRVATPPVLVCVESMHELCILIDIFHYKQGHLAPIEEKMDHFNLHSNFHFADVKECRSKL